MISNLFNAVSIALMTSIFGLGQVRADAIDSKSWVSGGDCVVYAQSTYHRSFNHSTSFSSYYVYDYDNTLIDNDALGSIADYHSWMNGMNEYQSNTVDSYTLSFATLTSYQVNNVNYFLGMRVGVPVDSNVNGFEFRSNAPCIVYQYCLSNSGIVIPHIYFLKGNRVTSIGVYDNNTTGNNIPDGATPSTDFVSSTDDVYFPYRLSQYLIVFGANTSGHVDLDLQIEFQFINGGNLDYQVGYNNGYESGYLSGKDDGYNSGYNAGLNLSHNSTFNNLFNAIADTPLRFLYGLFSFDLFGTSCLIIVLTLLTGIIVLHLVKKVWH